MTSHLLFILTLFGFTLFQETGANYIFDIRFPLIFSYNRTEKFTHFGATVALSPGPPQHDKDRPSAWVFIGAPTAVSISKNSQPEGLLWRCSIGRGYEEYSINTNEVCKIVNIDPASEKRGEGNPAREEHDNMWNGGSLEIMEGRLVTCGHRHTRGTKTYMNGLCYFLLNETSSKSESYLEEDGPMPKLYSHRLLPFFVPEPPKTNSKDQNFNFTNAKGNWETGHEWGMGQFGTSLHIPKHTRGNKFEVLMGAPGARMWSGAVVRYKDNASKQKGSNFRLNRNTNSPIFSEFVVGHKGIRAQRDGHWFEYFGYGLSSGKYFGDKTIYAGGSPRGTSLFGDVVIFDLSDNLSASSEAEQIYKRQIKIILPITPPSDAFGSYFGSVLFSMDVDGDGKDELFVGTPYYSLIRTTRAKRGAGVPGQQWTGDHGCVFVYFFNANKSLDGEPHIIQSNTQAPGARFGSAISHISWGTNKLETHVVIGAPQENDGHGAMYIFKYLHSNFEFVQKILASELLDGILGFGLSISLPLDVDLNETPDIAVGAYQSSQVVIFRTRSTARITGQVKFVDKSRASKNDGKVSAMSRKLTIKSCITVLKEVGKLKNMNIYVSLTLDSRFNISKNVTGLNKQHGQTYLYREHLEQASKDKIDNTICFKDFEVAVHHIKEDPMSKSYEIIQSIWYNDTTSTNSESDKMKLGTILEYSIGRLGTVSNQGKSGALSDFQPNYPYPIERSTRKFEANVAPNDCTGAICKPELHFKVEWIDIDNNRTLDPKYEVILGSISDITFKLTIINVNETAITPSFAIEWPRQGIIVNIDNNQGGPQAAENFLLQRHNCKENHQDSKLVYNCNFPNDITKFAPKIIQIPLSFKTAFATQPEHNFTIDFSIKPKDSDKRISGRSTLILKAESKMHLVGSKMEDTGLVPKLGRNQTEGELEVIKWKQSYWVRVDGKSGVKAHVKLAFPHVRKYGTTSKKIIIRTQITDDNVFCKSDIESDHHIGESLDPAHLPPAEAGGSTGNEIVPSGIQIAELEILGYPKSAQLINNNAFLVNCDTEDTSPDIGFSCFLINCDVIVPGDSSVELRFDLTMSKDEIDSLLSHEGKDEVLIASYGYGTIFNVESVNDTAQTLFKHTVSPVGAWVYVLSVIFGLLILISIIFVLYKCGFFKREEKERLQLLKAEARRSVMVPNFKPILEEDEQY